jgi:hypothetical protein
MLSDTVMVEENLFQGVTNMLFRKTGREQRDASTQTTEKACNINPKAR